MEEIIQKEVVNDYFTAGIKAEVILDMLLRPVLEKVLNQLLRRKDQGVHFITKEFPIPTEANDNHNCNVDYLMYGEKAVYLIELKTSSTSEDEKQLENYIKQIFGSGRLNENFGNLFGNRFIWMLNHVSASGIGKGKNFDQVEWKKLQEELGCEDYERLKVLFKRIVSNCDIEDDGTENNQKKYEKKAQQYLKKTKKTGSAKYLFQAGQILDSSPESWWDKKVQLIYIVPDTVTFKTKLAKVKDESKLNMVNVISIEDIRDQLNDNVEYEKMLKKILKEIC